MALIEANLVKRNRKDYNLDCLLNIGRIVNKFYDANANEGNGGIVLNYIEESGEKYNTIRYETSQSEAEFPDINGDTGEGKYLTVNAVARDVTDEGYNYSFDVALRNVIKAWESYDGNTYIEIEEGINRKQRYKITESFSDLKNSSKSVFIQDTEPDSDISKKGDIWIDTSS
jgi:hypothetical protein